MYDDKREPSSSSKIIDGSKTNCDGAISTNLSSSSKIIDGSKTKELNGALAGLSSSSKIIDGSKTTYSLFKCFASHLLAK